MNDEINLTGFDRTSFRVDDAPGQTTNCSVGRNIENDGRINYAITSYSTRYGSGQIIIPAAALSMLTTSLLVHLERADPTLRDRLLEALRKAER